MSTNGFFRELEDKTKYHARSALLPDQLKKLYLTDHVCHRLIEEYLRGTMTLEVCLIQIADTQSKRISDMHRTLIDYSFKFRDQELVKGAE